MNDYILKIKVSNIKSRCGNPIPNQFEIVVDGNIYFQSYNSTIAVKTPNGIYLDETYWDYSATTGKYRNKFLNEFKDETKAKIKSGEYKLIKLN